MKIYILRYGLVGGLISSLLGTINWLLIAPPFGVATSQTVGYLSVAISLLCIPLGIKYFRDHLNQSQVTFLTGLKIGFGITTMAALVLAIHSILFFVLQKEEFINWQRSHLDDAALQAFNEQLEQMPDFVYAPWFQGLVMFFMVFLIGLVINLLSAWILKSE